MNSLNFFTDLRRGWWHFMIDNIISECIFFLIRNILQMVHQSSSSSEYLFFSLPSGFFTCKLHYFATSTYQPHHYSSTSSLSIILDFLPFRALNLLRASSLNLLVIPCLSLDALLFTTYKAKCTLWKTLIMFVASDT